MEGRLPYDDFPVVFLPPYESPPAWVPPHERVYHPDYNNELTQFLPRTIVLKKPPGAQVRHHPPPTSTQTPAHGLPHGHHVPLGVAFPVFESRPSFPAPLLGKNRLMQRLSLRGAMITPDRPLRAARRRGGRGVLWCFPHRRTWRDGWDKGRHRCCPAGRKKALWVRQSSRISWDAELVRDREPLGCLR
uniref:PDZ domain containing 11 n=1 Tax=Accipiter nisus TaxID=211598 RepID=A0A8B9MZU2_9AVES